MKKICALLFLPLCLHCGAFAEENDAPDSGADLIVSPSFSNYLLAGAGVIASNATLFLFNHFIMRAEYADISAETIRANFRSAWVWDQDTFRVNQLGHPYQGSFYFAAARSNGIPFEAALLYNVLGSVSWEYICENETPSINDLIVTTMGGAAVGEMLHRLYLEARDAAFPLSFILSPMDALMGLITGKRPAQSDGDGVESFSTVVGMGPLWSSASFSDSRSRRSGFYPVNFYGGISVVYGNPYRAPHWKPYASFELDIMGGGTKGFYDVAVFSEGLLSRFGTVYGNYSTMMFGAAMDFDVRMSNLFSYADYGLGVVCKQQAEFPHRVSMDWSAGASWMFLGAGDFYELYQGIITHPDDGVERRLYDFSTGVMAKCRFKISQPAVGTFGASFLCAAAFTIGAAVPPKGSSGSQFIGMLSASYEHDILKNYSLGVAADWYFKKGFYDDAADVFQNVPQVSLFGRYCIK